MTIDVNDTAIIQVVLERFEKQRLPRMIEIKARVDQGQILNEFEIEFLDEALHDARNLLPTLERHPDYEPLLSQVIHFYKLITDQALANEKG